MNILVLETSSRNAQLALKCGSQLLERTSTSKSHSQSLLVLIDELINEAKITLKDIDCIGVSRGPGSFTGLRIGIAVGQGLAFAHNTPVVAVSSLSILAHEVKRQQSTVDSSNKLVLSTIDARMQQLYCAWYSVDTDIPKLLGTEQVLSPIDLITLKEPKGLNNHNAVFAGTGSIYADNLPINIQPMLKNNRYLQLQPTALSLLELSESLFQAGQALSCFELEPVYLRNKVTS